MRLFVRHRSDYLFSQPQARLVQLLRVSPGNHWGQSVVDWTLEVDRDARLRRSRDGYGNETTMLYVDGPLDRATITVSGEVLTEDHAGMIRGAVEPLAPAAFLQPTPLTAADAALVDFARGFDPAAEPLAAAHGLADALYDRLVPVMPDPAVDQRAAVRFAAGEVDAQGAAHILIAAARVIGLPARYVAGYVYRSDEAQAHAAHGWAELHVPGYGWIAFDAFEGRCPGEGHVRVAVGLDHLQAAPISGARTGGGDEVLAVEVHVVQGPARPH